MKKSLSLILLAACAALPASAAIDGISGEGTSESPFLISSASDWNTLVTDSATISLGTYLKLTADITFDSTTPAKAFTNLYGELDGGGYTIDVDTVELASGYGSLFCRIGQYAKVYDLTVKGTVTAFGSTTGSGGIAYEVWGTLENVKSYIDFNVDASAKISYVGGITNRTSTSSSITAQLINCVYYGTMTSNYIAYFGGITGYGTGNAVYTNCGNEGTITSTYASTSIGAGIVGYLSSGTTTFTGCYNKGNITFYNAAGIVGTIQGQTSTNKADVTITGCYNEGTVTSEKSNAGGIIVNTSTTNMTGVTITGCYNAGTVSSTGRSGGIVASGTNYITVTGCYNIGTVKTSKYGVGGIAGFMTASTSISDCYNAGEVTATAASVGGIVGYATASLTYGISGCFNVGTVSSNSTTTSTTYSSTSAGCYVGGIAGYIKSTGTVTSCYNAGAVTGANAVGGIIGGGAATVTTAYNIGTVSSSSTTARGNVAGDTTTTQTGTYYLTASGLSSPIDSSTGLSYAQLAALDLGDSWTTGDNYTYPRITAIADNDYAKTYAAAVIPGVDSDTYDAMTGVFYLGAPDGVTWTADNSVISYDGQMGYFNADYAGGTITMTATCGDVSATTELVYGVITGIESVLSDDDPAETELVSEILYNTSGQEVAKPADGQKAIYIVHRVYNDGTTETVKEVR